MARIATYCGTKHSFDISGFVSPGDDKITVEKLFSALKPILYLIRILTPHGSLHFSMGHYLRRMESSRVYRRSD